MSYRVGIILFGWLIALLGFGANGFWWTSLLEQHYTGSLLLQTRCLNAPETRQGTSPFDQRLICPTSEKETKKGLKIKTPVQHPIMNLWSHRLDLVYLQGVHKGSPKELKWKALQAHHWEGPISAGIGTPSRAKPNLPKWKREPITVGTTLNMTKKSQGVPIQCVGRRFTWLKCVHFEWQDGRVVIIDQR